MFEKYLTTAKAGEIYCLLVSLKGGHVHYYYYYYYYYYFCSSINEKVVLFRSNN